MFGNTTVFLLYRSKNTQNEGKLPFSICKQTSWFAIVLTVLLLICLKTDQLVCLLALAGGVER